MVEAHGGEVAVESEQWEGGGRSTFSFTVPLAKGERRALRDPAARPPVLAQQRAATETEREKRGYRQRRAAGAGQGSREQGVRSQGSLWRRKRPSTDGEEQGVVERWRLEEAERH